MGRGDGKGMGREEERREGEEKGEIAHFLDHVKNASGYFKTFDMINHSDHKTIGLVSNVKSMFQML